MTMAVIGGGYDVVQFLNKESILSFAQSLALYKQYAE